MGGSPGPVGILQGSKRPNAARLFTNFMFSKEYSQALVKTFNYPLRADVAPPTGVPKLDQIKVIRNTVDQLTKELPAAKELENGHWTFLVVCWSYVNGH